MPGLAFRLKKNPRRNLELLAQFLNVELERRFFFVVPRVKGSYKGRPITAEIYFGEGGGLSVSIQPRRFPEKQPLFMLSYPSVTENTSRVGDRITYANSRTTKAVFSREWSRGDFVPILEELTRAAEQVESRSRGAP